MHNYTHELMDDRDRWRKASEELWNFIITNISIVGHDEIEAFARAKEFYNIARNYD